VKRFAVIGTLIATVFLTLVLTGCSATFSSPLEPSAQKVTLEEAGSILGVPIPVPAYLTLVTGEEAMGTGSQRYDVKSPMRMVIRWYPEGGVPIKLPVEKVRINESWGFLQGRGDHRALWWVWFPEPDKPAMFELVLAASKRISKEELVKVAESISVPLIREYPDEAVRVVYEEIKRELFDERNLYDVIPQTGYNSQTIILGFAGPGVFMVVDKYVTRFQESLLESPEVSREQAIEIATNMLTDLPVAAVVARGDMRADLHGWYWEVTFDNVDATYDELMPFPLKPPPPGGAASKAYPGIYQSVVISVDAETGDPRSAGASKEPKPGPYVSRERAISSARERITTWISEAWLERAMVKAYLRGDIWIVLFWEEGASIEDRSSGLSVNRFQVSVDAVTGEAVRSRRG